MSDFNVDKPLARRTLADGRILEVWKMVCTFRLTETEPQNDNVCWSDAWCFTTSAACFAACISYDGEHEPDGWVKHPPSGRRRRDGTAATEYVDRD